MLLYDEVGLMLPVKCTEGVNRHDGKATVRKKLLPIQVFLLVFCWCVCLRTIRVQCLQRPGEGTRVPDGC